VTLRLRFAAIACVAACALASGAAFAGTEPAEHDAAPPPINWWHGLLWEKKDAKPGLLFRAPGEPAPFVAAVLNFALLVAALVYFGRKPLAEALVKRRESIMRDMNEARRLREEAEKRLAEYEAKLGRLGEELEAIRNDYRQLGERDKERIVREARERSRKMRADAEQILAQELRQMHQDLLAETVENATALAIRMIADKTTVADQDRFVETFLAELKGRYTTTGSRDAGRGGAA
jgi:F-type H+-transporting ATPase subunit b